MQNYILVLKMPTGRGWVLGAREGGVALLPVEDNLLMMKDIFGFDTIRNANKFIKSLKVEKPELADLLAQVTVLKHDEALDKK